jgi:ATP phosphoribosyltransferase
MYPTYQSCICSICKTGKQAFKNIKAILDEIITINNKQINANINKTKLHDIKNMIIKLEEHVLYNISPLTIKKIHPLTFDIKSPKPTPTQQAENKQVYEKIQVKQLKEILNTYNQTISGNKQVSYT